MGVIDHVSASLGWAVAMIHGGNAIEGYTENIVTYATPIEELLESIRQQLSVHVHMGYGWEEGVFGGEAVNGEKR